MRRRRDDDDMLPIKADSFKLYVCGDRRCGIHVVGLRRNIPFCEIVMDQDHIPDVIGKLQDVLYRIEALKD